MNFIIEVNNYKNRILFFLFINTNVVIIVRHLIEDGITKIFLERLIVAKLLIFFLISLTNLKDFKNKLFILKSFVSKRFVFLTFILSVIFLILNQILIKNTFGQLIFLFAFFNISIVFMGLYELRKNSDYFLDFNLKKYMLNIKYAIPYILFTLIPVVRYLVANSGIFFTNEKVLLFSLFLFLSEY